MLLPQGCADFTGAIAPIPSIHEALLAICQPLPPLAIRLVPPAAPITPTMLRGFHA
jgi:hypothetical protein